ncbi:MAG: HpcH/HpaI aldolase/citrate lyase family protein [Caulobacteraceae bacterium]|nr:HpcH/HpaI aldolase/citrate lyase family protein [Caulobacter sp.]
MNAFIEKLRAGEARLGLWRALTDPYTAEICARAGYGWLMFDGEHAPNTLPTLLAQLQAVAPFPVEPVARPPAGEAWMIKQYLDIGFRTLLAPMVDGPEQAAALVAATRFPPRGVRGVASATSRASGFGAEPGYLAHAHERTGLIVQIETRAGLAAIDSIAATDGVDALFIGPADLSAALGHLGDPRHPDAQAAIDDGFARIRASGKPAGIFALDAEDARRRLAQGFAFVSVGTDIGVLSAGARALRERCEG